MEAPSTPSTTAAEPAPAAPPAQRTRSSKTMRIDILPGVPGGPDVPSARVTQSLAAPLAEIAPDAFMHLFLHAYDATLLTNTEGRIIEANLRAKEFLQRSEEELLRMNVVECISGAEPGLVGTLCESLAQERYARIHAWCRRRDGSFFPAEIAVHRLTGNRPILCFFIRDITWRKEAEEELQTVHTAIRSARTGIAVADLDGKVVYANPAMAEMCSSATEDALRGRPLSDLVDTPAKAIEAVESVRQGRNWNGEMTLVRPDGSRLAVQAVAAVNADTEQQIIGMVLSLVDISDRLRAQAAERKVERNRVMMESLGSVCHHLGQPSTVLLSSIEMMLRLRNSDPQTLEDLLRLSLSAAETLRTTLRELNELRQYRSEPYLVSSDPSGKRIVSLGPAETQTVADEPALPVSAPPA